MRAEREFVGLRGQRLEAVAVGAQQIGQQVGVGGVGLAAVAAVARSGGFDDVGVDRHDRQAGFDQGIDEQPRGALDGDALDAGGVQTAHQLGQALGVVLAVQAL